jgi:hypothetical protein
MRKNKFLQSGIGYSIYSIFAIIAFILSKSIVMLLIGLMLLSFSVIMLKEYKNFDGG